MILNEINRCHSIYIMMHQCYLLLLRCISYHGFCWKTVIVLTKHFATRLWIYFNSYNPKRIMAYLKKLCTHLLPCHPWPKHNLTQICENWELWSTIHLEVLFKFFLVIRSIVRKKMNIFRMQSLISNNL